MTYISKLIEAHPIRKTAKQKQAFREWAVSEAQSLGYTADVEKLKSNHNIIIGNPETASAVFTAHYDTPPVMPVPNFITPKNILFYLIYQVGIVLIMLALCSAVGFGVEALTSNVDLGFYVGYIAYFGLMFLMLYGPANKNNVNDNSSGVSAVFELMARIPQEERAKVAIILFDNEEKGMAGSGAYASKHKDIKNNTLIINMDCVGDGENILFFANKKTRELEEYGKLTTAMSAQTGRTLLMNKFEGCFYPSDQSQFKYGIAVCACKRAKVVGYYCDKIHTKKDTTCEQENLDFLANGLAQFVSEL